MEESTKLGASKKVKPVLEEFIPLKNRDCDEKEEGLKCNNEKDKDCRDKKNWLSSVQLWNANDDNKTTNCLNQNSNAQTKINENRHGLKTANSDVVGRAFVPFKPYPGFAVAKKDEFSVDGLSLITPPRIKIPKEESLCVGNGLNPSRADAGSPSNSRAGSAAQPQQQAARKQRRCWSPELHRRFVNALQELGGPQVATPKQIRELMQVDGLTNDEVKSHLQKYRLHTRRVPAGSTAAAPASMENSAVLGVLWVNQDQYGDSSKPCGSESGSPQGPFQLGTNGIRSPITGDESMEEDSDAKSEGYSWKKSYSQTKDI